jgi:hypothetical protein
MTRKIYAETIPRLFGFDRMVYGNPMPKGRNWYAELQEELTRDKQMELT